MNVYTLRVRRAGGTTAEQIRWELFVHREIRDVTRFADGTLAIAYEGEEPNVTAWRETLRSFGVEVASPNPTVRRRAEGCPAEACPSPELPSCSSARRG